MKVYKIINKRYTPFRNGVPRTRWMHKFKRKHPNSLLNPLGDKRVLGQGHYILKIFPHCMTMWKIFLPCTIIRPSASGIEMNLPLRLVTCKLDILLCNKCDGIIHVWVHPQYNEPLEVIDNACFQCFSFFQSRLKILVKHQGFFLVGGCWLGFRVSKYVFFA